MKDEYNLNQKPYAPIQHKEREFDAMTLVLASLLAAIVIGAIGYGIFNSSKGVSTVPSLTAGTLNPALIARPRPNPDIPNARVTTGTSDERR